jgi:hypothetical protein
MSDATIEAFNEAAIRISLVQDEEVREALAALLLLFQESIKDTRGYKAGSRDVNGRRRP